MRNLHHAINRKLSSIHLDPCLKLLQDVPGFQSGLSKHFSRHSSILPPSHIRRGNTHHRDTQSWRRFLAGRAAADYRVLASPMASTILLPVSRVIRQSRALQWHTRAYAEAFASLYRCIIGTRWHCAVDIYTGCRSAYDLCWRGLHQR